MIVTEDRLALGDRRRKLLPKNRLKLTAHLAGFLSARSLA